MANLCDYQMKIGGENENINSFLDALQQKGLYAIGRGATVDIVSKDENEYEVVGYCKWSVVSSLIDDAISMHEQKMSGKGTWDNGDGFIDDHEFLTLYEASAKWNLKIEIVSWECGCEFSEKFIINNGKEKFHGVCDYEEIWDEDSGELVETVGGFERLF